MKVLKVFALVSCLVSGSAFGAGAIAINKVLGDANPGYGFATRDTLEAAKAAAMENCQKDPKNTNCMIRVWFEHCGAVAASSDPNNHGGTGYGDTLQAAEAMALGSCGDSNTCKVVASTCH
jgi:hypothetical protein